MTATDTDKLQHCRRIGIVCNSRQYFFAHKAALFRDFPPGVKIDLLTGGTDGARDPQGEITIHPITLNRYKQIALGDAWAFFQLFAYIRHSRPDYVVAITIKANLLAASAVAANRITGGGLPNVTVMSPGLGRIFSKGNGSFLHAVRYRAVIVALRLLSRITNFKSIFENEHDLEIWRKLGIARQHCSKAIKGTGIDIKDSLPRKTTEGPLRVVFAGRMLRLKGAQKLIAAARELDGKVAIHVDIYGDSDIDEKDALRIDPSSLPPNVTLHGQVSQTEIINALKQAHCVCLPTQYMEGLPRILLEGAIQGCALIATDIAGCTDVVRNGETGCLIRVQNANDIVAQLVQILSMFANNRMTVIAMGEQAANLVTKGGFSLDQVRCEFQNFILSSDSGA